LTLLPRRERFTGTLAQLALFVLLQFHHSRGLGVPTYQNVFKANSHTYVPSGKVRNPSLRRSI
jgi:hypothetical protein